MKLTDILFYSTILTVILFAVHMALWWALLLRKWWLKDFNTIFGS
jgi:hypothetical protein